MIGSFWCFFRFLVHNTLKNIQKIVIVHFFSIFFQFSIEMRKFLLPVQPNLDVMEKKGCHIQIQRPKKHRRWSYSSFVYFKKKFFVTQCYLIIETIPPCSHKTSTLNHNFEFLFDSITQLCFMQPFCWLRKLLIDNDIFIQILTIECHSVTSPLTRYMIISYFPP